MDNDGLPHTLEHLVFLGSEDYPYKEVLDLLANRALADRLASSSSWHNLKHISIPGPMPGPTLTTRATQCTPPAPVGSFTSSLSTWITFYIQSSGGLIILMETNVTVHTFQGGGLPDWGAPHQRGGPGCRSGLQWDAGGSNKNPE